MGKSSNPCCLQALKTLKTVKFGIKSKTVIVIYMHFLLKIPEQKVSAIVRQYVVSKCLVVKLRKIFTVFQGMNKT